MIKIAIIGASDSVEKIFNVLEKKYLDIEFILKKEDKIEKTTRIILEEESNVDGFFLTGIGIYHALLRKNKKNFSKSITYLKRGSMSIIKALWEIPNIEKKTNLKIGFDVIEEKKFLEICKEFEIDLEDYYHQEYILEKNEEEYLKNYIELYRTGQINCILTSFGYIYKELKKLNIDVFRIQSTNLDIENEFENLLYRVKLKKAEKMKISILIVKLENTYKIINNKLIAERKRLEKIFLDYSKTVQGILQPIISDEYLIISNKELITNKFYLKELHKIINKNEYFVINIGIGEGDTIFNAEINARKALKLSKKEKENSIFIYSANEVIGPILDKKEIKYEINEKIKDISVETGISINILQKLSLLQKKQKENYFKSCELVEYLNLSERSINRVMNILLKKGYIKEKIEKQIIGAGRPRRKFNFKF